MLCPVEQCSSISSHLLPTLSIFSLPALEDLFLLPLFIFSWVFPFFPSFPVLEWRSFCASYLPPFSLDDLTSLSFALLSILLYFLLCSSLLVLDFFYTSNSKMPNFELWHSCCKWAISVLYMWGIIYEFWYNFYSIYIFFFTSATHELAHNNRCVPLLGEKKKLDNPGLQGTMFRIRFEYFEYLELQTIYIYKAMQRRKVLHRPSETDSLS